MEEEEEDLKAVLYQTMPNLHNLYKSTERNKITENPRIYTKLHISM